MTLNKYGGKGSLTNKNHTYFLLGRDGGREGGREGGGTGDVRMQNEQMNMDKLDLTIRNHSK